MPKDNSNQGDYLMAKWMSDFKTGFSKETDSRIRQGFGQLNTRPGSMFILTPPGTVSGKAPNVRQTFPAPGRNITYVKV